MPDNSHLYMKDKIQGAAWEMLPQLSSWRRHLHQHPELSFEEFQTMEFVAGQLDKLGIPYQKGIAGTGIIALIEGAQPGPCLALRADMDALPISEKNEVPYCSKHEGRMHACGHDAHTTCLLGAATILWQFKKHIKGTVKLIFQPGEEKSPGGASLMIQAGALEQPKVDAIIGLHVYPEMPSGTLGFKSGQYMASADEIHIRVVGKGGHAALPHKTVDPIVIAANIIVQLQQIISRRSNPLTPTVLSFGQVSGGHVNNVIPEEVWIRGTLRTFDESWRHEALELIKRIATENALIWGGNAEVHIPPGYPSLYNHEALNAQVRRYAEEYLGEENVASLPLRMTAEDFAFYTLHVPACFFRLGTNAANEQYTYPVHHPNFDIDEKALAIGTGAMAWLAINYLNEI